MTPENEALVYKYESDFLKIYAATKAQNKELKEKSKKLE